MNLPALIKPSIDGAGGASAGEIMPRATAEAIVRKRNDALSQYERAHAAMTVASETTNKAHELARSIGLQRENRYNHHIHSDKVKFMHVGDVQEKPDYMKLARKIVDTEAWSHIIEITELERLMDKQAKDTLYQQLLSDPPEATLENIYATLEQFTMDAGTIFRRGIANCFSSLDRRFRSHDGFKIGHRMILDRTFDEWGSWRYSCDQRSAMIDVERVFREIDSNPLGAGYAGIVGQIEADRRGGGLRRRQSETENEYFKVRCYKNGNMHIWFKRDDLLEKVNKLLAEYYGEVVPDGMTPEDDGGLFTPKTALAKNYGFFPTPDKAAEELLDKVGLYREKGKPPLTILEPSAGTGNLAKRLLHYDRDKCSSYSWDKLATDRNQVDCIEVQADRAAELQASGLYRRVLRADFLQVKPETTGLYDKVVMNPPFDRERDIDHVMHALQFLKPDGVLHAIMSAGTEFRETRKSIAFRKLMTEMKGTMRDLPAGSFSSVGTHVNTLILRVRKDGGHAYW